MQVIRYEDAFQVELTDDYTIEIRQAKRRFEYSVHEARAIAAEIVAVCDNFEVAREQDRAAASYPKPGPPRKQPGSVNDPTHY